MTAHANTTRLMIMIPLTDECSRKLSSEGILPASMSFVISVYPDDRCGGHCVGPPSWIATSPLLRC